MRKNLLSILLVTLLLINIKVLGQGTTQQSITFSAIPGKTIGDAHFTLVASSQSNLPVTFTVTSGGGIASVSGSTVTLSNTQAGTVTIQANQAGNTNFAAAAAVVRSFTVAKKANVITFSTIPDKTYGAAAFGLTATSSQGLPVVFSISSGSSIASLSGSTVSLSNTAFGSVIIQATQAGNDTINAATTVVKSFNVSKLSNTISFATIPAKTLDAADFALSGSASSGLPVTYTVTSGGSIASVSGSMVSLSDTAFGNVTIKASQTGNDTIAAAVSVSKTFTVSQLSNVITFATIPNKTFGTGNFTLSGSASSGLPVSYSVTSGGTIASVTGSTVSLSGLAFGTVTIRATQAGSSSVAAAVSVSKTFTVSQHSNVITFATIPNKAFGASSFALSASASSTLPVTFTVTSGGTIASVTGSMVSLSNTTFGTVTIKASQAGNDTVAAAVSVSKTFTVSQLTNTISFAAIPAKLLGAADFALSGSASSGLPVTYTVTSGSSIASVSGSMVSLSDTAYGNVTIQASQAGNDTITAAVSVSKTFTVSQLSNVITFATIPNKTFGTGNFTLSGSASSGLPVSYSVTSGGTIASVTGSTVSLSGLAFGTVTIRATQAGSSSVAAAVSVSKTFTVSQHSNVITFATIPNKTLGASSFALSASASSTLPVTFTVTSGGTIASVTGSMVSLSNTAFGTVTIQASQAGNDTVAAATSVSKTFTVSQRSNVITFATIPNKTIGNPSFSLSGSASSGLTVAYTITSGSSIASVSGSTVSLSGTAYGIVTIQATQAGSSSVAAAVSVSKSFTVSPISNTITFATIPDKIYGAADFSLSGSASSGLPVSYTVTSGGTIASVTGSTVSLSGTAFGTVTIRATQAGGSSVATAIPVSKSFTVSKLANTITFASIPNKVFGDANFTLGGSASSGLPLTYTVTTGGTIASVSGSTVSLTGLAFGTVTITASQAGNDTLKAAISVSKSFIVSKKSNLITFAGLADKKLLDADFALTATSSSGLPVTYAITSAGGIATLTGSTVGITDTSTGTVTIRATQAGNDTVAAASAVVRSFAVSKAAQTITWTSIANQYTTGTPFTVSAVASSGLSTVLTVYSGPATISGTIVTLTGATGTVKLRATQAGNTTYNAATYSDVTFSVSVAVPTSKTDSIMSVPELTYTDKTALYPNPTSGFVNASSDKILKSVNVYNNLGSLVYSENFTDLAFSKQLNLTHLPKGLYFIIFSTKDAQSMNKIIIE